MKKQLILFYLLLLNITLYAQSIEVSGLVTDAQYKTPVPYAVVFVEHTQIGVVANNVGAFSLSIPDSLRSSRLVSVGEGYRLTYISPENQGEAPLQIALQPLETAEGVLSPLGGDNAKKPGAIGSLLNKAVQFVLNDWVPLGDPETNRFDFGRIQTFPTYNPIEGVRLRAGVASNSRLSPHFFVKGYAAYGFGDQQFKYRGEAICRSTGKRTMKMSFQKTICGWFMRRISIRRERCTPVH